MIARGGSCCAFAGGQKGGTGIAQGSWWLCGPIEEVNNVESTEDFQHRTS